jgi:ankyrin
VAAKWGKSNMVSLLLESGANIEAKTRDGLTALHCAARSGHDQVIDMLLQRNAPISSKTKVGVPFISYFKYIILYKLSA